MFGVDDLAIGLMVSSVAGPVLGGILGSNAAAGDREAARRAAEEAYAEILNLGAPPDLSKRIIQEKFKQAGIYTPQLENEINVQFEKVAQTPEGKQALKTQMEALNLVKQRAETGLSATDRAAMNQLRQQVATATQGRLESIRQAAAARGQTGSGAELAQQLAAASSASAEESAAADRLAAQAQQAALQAAMQSGELGRGIEEQQFAEQQAQTEIANREKLFNIQNSIARQRANIQAQNQAQLYNLAEQQRAQDINTQMENAERMRQSQASRQYWQDQAQLAGMRSGARLGQAQQYRVAGDEKAQMYAGAGAAIGAGAGAGLGYLGKINSPAPIVVNTPSTSGNWTVSGGKYDTPSEGNIFGVNPNPLGYAYGGKVESKCSNCGSMNCNKGCYVKGGMVKGEEVVPGDSYANDIYDAKLSAGEAVVPKQIMERGPEAGYGYLYALINRDKQVK